MSKCNTPIKFMFTLILCACIEFMVLHKSILYHVTLNHTINQWPLTMWLINDLLIYFYVIVNKIIY